MLSVHCNAMPFRVRLGGAFFLFVNKTHLNLIGLYVIPCPIPYCSHIVSCSCKPPAVGLSIVKSSA